MRWLSVDPGEDAGWALWEDHTLLDAGDSKLWPFIDEVARGVGMLPEIPFRQPSRFRGIRRIVCEDFKLYPWKLRTHELDWDKVRTARGIGALTLIARFMNLEFVLQPASIKKAAEAAGASEYFLHPLTPNRHANDAIRHGVFYDVTDGQFYRPVDLTSEDPTSATDGGSAERPFVARTSSTDQGPTPTEEDDDGYPST